MHNFWKSPVQSRICDFADFSEIPVSAFGNHHSLRCLWNAQNFARQSRLEQNFSYNRTGLCGTPKKQSDRPALSIIPLKNRDLFEDRVEKANKSVPLRPEFRLNISRLTRYDCSSIAYVQVRRYGEMIATLDGQS
jgi:hypothetical protein